MTSAARNRPAAGGIEDALGEARARYVARRPQSEKHFRESLDYMPGGNTRSVLFHEPFPLRMVSAEGCRVRDADGHEYVNLLGEYTAGLFGHGEPRIQAAISRALERGLSLSGHNPDETRLSRVICKRFPSIDKVRFTNSGSEANLMAIAAARYVTGKSKVMVFEGGYHGGLLYFTGGGMPLNAPYDYVVGRYNDVARLEELVRAHGHDLACILVEPVQGAAGCIPARMEFLTALRACADRTGALLIFDEVMTSRLSLGGAQQLWNVTPDMTTLGKYMGGGLTFGAFGGRDRVMQIFDPRNPDAIPHAGTFNNNSLTMAAGAVAMGEVLTAPALDELNRRGDELRQRLERMARERDLALCFTGVGSMIAVHGLRGPVSRVDDLAHADDGVKELVFLDALEAGYYMARRGFMALMLSLGEGELDGFAGAMQGILDARRAELA